MSLTVALHCAASRGHSNCMTTLIQDCGAIVDSKDRTAGCTPLFYAITLGHIDCVSVLLERGADASYQDKKGRRYVRDIWWQTYKSMFNLSFLKSFYWMLMFLYMYA